MTGGFIFGFLGVLGFSVTLPATKAAIVDLDPTVVGLGRALLAALLAGLVLAIKRERLPSKAELRGLVVVAAGVIVGFPWFSALAKGSIRGNLVYEPVLTTPYE